jgi:hypothetical protein
MFNVNVNCKWAENPDGRCKNKLIKRSLFGIGARCCVKCWDNNKKCAYHSPLDKPYPPPPPPPSFLEIFGSQKIDCNNNRVCPHFIPGAECKIFANKKCHLRSCVIECTEYVVAKELVITIKSKTGE